MTVASPAPSVKSPGAIPTWHPVTNLEKKLPASASPLDVVKSATTSPVGAKPSQVINAIDLAEERNAKSAPKGTGYNLAGSPRDISSSTTASNPILDSATSQSGAPQTVQRPQSQNTQPKVPEQQKQEPINIRAQDVFLFNKPSPSSGTSGEVPMSRVKTDQYSGGYLYKTETPQHIGEDINVPVPGVPFITIGGGLRAAREFSESVEAPLYERGRSLRSLDTLKYGALGLAAGMAKSPASTARFFTNPEGIKSIPSLPGQLGKLQHSTSLEAGLFLGETAGNVALSHGVFKGVGQVGNMVKNAYISTGAQKIPLADVTTEGVITGTEPMPLIRSIRESQARFEAARTPTGTIKVSTASPSAITGNKIGVFGKAGAGLEDPGVYVTPKGSASLYFTGVKSLKNAPSEISLNPFKNILKVPTVTTFEVSKVVRYPRSVISKPGFADLAKYQEEFLAPKGQAVVTKRSEIGMGEVGRQKFRATADFESPGGLTVKKGEMRTEAGTSELEAVVPVGTKFSYVVPSNALAKLKGFSEYTTFEGKNIALRSANVEGVGKGVTGKTVSLSGEQLAKESRGTSEVLSGKTSTPYPSISSLIASSRTRPSETKITSSVRAASNTYASSVSARSGISGASGISGIGSFLSSGSLARASVPSTPGVSSGLSGGSGISLPKSTISVPPSSPPSTPSGRSGTSTPAPPFIPSILRGKGPPPFKNLNKLAKPPKMTSIAKPRKFDKVVGIFSEGFSRGIYGKSTLDRSYKGSREIFSPSRELASRELNPGKILSGGGPTARKAFENNKPTKFRHLPSLKKKKSS